MRKNGCKPDALVLHICVLTHAARHESSLLNRQGRSHDRGRRAAADDLHPARPPSGHLEPDPHPARRGGAEHATRFAPNQAWKQ
jgi:hypothetical protein